MAKLTEEERTELAKKAARAFYSSLTKEELSERMKRVRAGKSVRKNK